MSKKSVGYFNVEYKLDENINQYNSILFIVLLINKDLHIIVNQEYVEPDNKIFHKEFASEYRPWVYICKNSNLVLKAALLVLENTELDRLTTWHLGFDITMLHNSNYDYKSNYIIDELIIDRNINPILSKPKVILFKRYNHVNIISALPLFAEKNEKQQSYQLGYIIKEFLGDQYLRPVEDLKHLNGIEYHRKMQEKEYAIPNIMEVIHETIALKALNDQMNFLEDIPYNALK